MTQASLRARLKLDHELSVASDLEHGQRVVAEIDSALHRGRQAVWSVAGGLLRYDGDPLRPHRQGGGRACADHVNRLGDDGAARGQANAAKSLFDIFDRAGQYV